MTELSLASKFKMMLKGATNINAFANLDLRGEEHEGARRDIRAKYPRTPEGFGEWRKLANDKVGEAQERFKPNPV